jgi:hypothetical protein
MSLSGGEDALLNEHFQRMGSMREEEFLIDNELAIADSFDDALRFRDDIV